jgi:large conductance mechanosensitive channel
VLKGFREFIARGNVIDLAVGVVIGAAFTSLVNAFVANFINPIIGLLGGKDLSAYILCINPPDGSEVCFYKDGALQGLGIGWGAMLSAIITFLLTALVVYFVFVLPMNKYRARFTTPEEAEAEADAAEIALLKEIRDELRAQRGA